MMVIELREALLDKALDQLEEAKKYGKKCKLAMCELEDTLYECYESDKDYDEEDYDPSSMGDNEEGEFEIDYRDRDSRSGKRRAMRMKYRDDEDTVRGSWRRSSSMRRAMRNRY